MVEGEAHPEDTNRREFLNRFLWGSGLAFFGALVYPLFRYLTPPPQEEEMVASVNLGKADEFPVNSGKVFRFGSRPGLLIRDREGRFRAFFATCTHLDCIVQYKPDEHDIWCACHNGRYDLNGRNISGPPPRPLTPLRVNVLPESNEVVVTLEPGGGGES